MTERMAVICKVTRASIITPTPFTRLHPHVVLTGTTNVRDY